MLKFFLKKCFSSLQGVSYVHGTSSAPLQYKSIGQKLWEIRDKFPEHKALISNHQDKIFTYQQLVDMSENLAAAFRKLGLKKHERVGIYSPNNYQWVVVQLAASFADLILVNINPAYKKSELEYCLKNVGVKCLITASSFKSTNYIEMINDICKGIEKQNSEKGEFQFKNLPDLKYLVKIDDEKSPGFLNFNDLFDIVGSKDVENLREITRKISPDEPTNIQFTSGTTGSPKGATLSHFNILNNGYFIGERMLLTDKDVVCIPVPLYHCFGMVLGNLACINRGAAMVYPSDSFNAQKTLDTVTKYKCTGLYGVPTMFIEMFNLYDKDPHKYDMSNLRTGIMAGSQCPQVLMEKVVNIFKMKHVTICYGMTETSPVSFQSNPDDSFDDRCGTVGTVFPHVEAKIVDSEGHIVPIHQPGEFLVRGYLTMKGYFNDLQKTQETIDENGWLKSGDLAQMDDRGYLKIVGRKKDMIIRGGENVYPREIEEFLLRMPGVQDISIVGVPDNKFGEEIFACVIVKEENKKSFDIKQVYNYCHGQIAHYKIPKYVKIVDTFPLTVTGKIQKYQIANDLLKEQESFQNYLIRSY